MKARELAEILLRSPDLEVLVEGYESGFDAVVVADAIKTTPNPCKSEARWQGDFNESEEDEEGDIRLVIRGTRDRGVGK